MTGFRFAPLLVATLGLGFLAGCTAAIDEPGTEMEISAPEVTLDTTADPSAAPTEDTVTISDPWSKWDRSGTVFLAGDAITPESPSDFLGISFIGTSTRETFDRRIENWVNQDSWIFSASYKCGLSPVEVIVNPEFTESEALYEATRVAKVLGQLPVGARKAVLELWIHDGWELAGGGNGSILVYSDYFDSELNWIEEAFIHEAAHTSIDYQWDGVVDEAAWAAAADADGQYISDYAADFPDREDIAESYGAYMVWAIHQEQGIFPESAAEIAARMPARLAYFQSLGPDYGPLPSSCGQ